MSKPEIGAGDVRIILKGKEYLLKPTLKAALELSKGDGLQGMVRRCLALDMDAIVMVIVQGLGRSSRDLQQIVYETGLRNVNAECIKFLGNLANGGTPINDTEDGENKDPPLENQLQSVTITPNLPDTPSGG